MGRSDCSENNVCVCKSRKKAEPEPEPEPSTAKPEPEPEPSTTNPEPKIAFAIDSGSNCLPTERVVQKSDCEAKAKELGITYRRFFSKRLSKKWPAGCFLLKNRKQARLFFNTRNSTATCDNHKVRCICARPKPKTAKPEPEPEPATAKLEPEPEPATAKPEPKIAFAIDSGPNCPPTER